MKTHQRRFSAAGEEASAAVFPLLMENREPMVLRRRRFPFSLQTGNTRLNDA